ncbi:MAG: aminotransferase class V-fold PLP-dependent enzyme [Chloroflexi bacterium]|nr:aminotransferase class V-fold PLP-dependent enzyme [Chloroflexota bacterium]MBP6804993.1 aminotransferase class V-fold PLP-dependent enzyme [Chloroflexota bacterium]
MNKLRDQFLLNPDIVFLNHGSFGATPRPVFAAYQEWQRLLEAQPVQFIATDMPGYFAAARERLAAYLHAAAADLVYVPNATFGVNVVARSLKLGPGDEILTTDHEYGACDNAWVFACGQTGAIYRHQPITLPVSSADEMVAQFWQGVTPRTKVIYLSHITSPTALRLPVEAICARARQAGILTLIDGAHAPGQIDLDLPALGADFYTGNCHKWMMSAKGAGFLYARPEAQPLLEPLIVSWGWGPNRDFSFGSDFLDYFQWWGTKDPAAALSVPVALDFMAIHDWTAVRQQCHELAVETLGRLTELTHLPPIYPASPDFFGQMVAAPLPQLDAKELKRRLYAEYRVEVPVVAWNGRQFIRVSIQGYNTRSDVDALVAALAELLPQFR